MNHNEFKNLYKKMLQVENNKQQLSESVAERSAETHELVQLATGKTVVSESSTNDIYKILQFMGEASVNEDHLEEYNDEDDTECNFCGSSLHNGECPQCDEEETNESVSEATNHEAEAKRQYPDVVSIKPNDSQFAKGYRYEDLETGELYTKHPYYAELDKKFNSYDDFVAGRGKGDKDAALWADAVDALHGMGGDIDDSDSYDWYAVAGAIAKKHGGWDEDKYEPTDEFVNKIMDLANKNLGESIEEAFPDDFVNDLRKKGVPVKQMTPDIKKKIADRRAKKKDPNKDNKTPSRVSDPGSSMGYWAEDSKVNEDFNDERDLDISGIQNVFYAMNDLSDPHALIGFVSQNYDPYLAKEFKAAWFDNREYSNKLAFKKDIIDATIHGMFGDGLGDVLEPAGIDLGSVTESTDAYDDYRDRKAERDAGEEFDGMAYDDSDDDWADLKESRELARLAGIVLNEAQGTAAKYADKKGMMGGKYDAMTHSLHVSKDAQKKFIDRRHETRRKQAATDPGGARKGLSSNVVDTDKAMAKAKKKGVSRDDARKAINWKNTNSAIEKGRLPESADNLESEFLNTIQDAIRYAEESGAYGDVSDQDFEQAFAEASKGDFEGAAETILQSFSDQDGGEAAVIQDIYDDLVSDFRSLFSDEQVEEDGDGGSDAGAVATGGDAAPKNPWGNPSVYESWNDAVNAEMEKLRESMNVSVNSGDDMEPSMTVTATGEDAYNLSELLQLAGRNQAAPCGAEDVDMNEELANEPNERDYSMKYMLDRLSGGLNGPKKQVNPNNRGDNPLAMKGLDGTGVDLDNQ